MWSGEWSPRRKWGALCWVVQRPWGRQRGCVWGSPWHGEAEYSKAECAPSSWAQPGLPAPPLAASEIRGGQALCQDGGGGVPGPPAPAAASPDGARLLTLPGAASPVPALEWCGGQGAESSGCRGHTLSVSCMHPRTSPYPARRQTWTSGHCHGLSQPQAQKPCKHPGGSKRKFCFPERT